ncbi:hypothetical protein HJC23_000880 [Cyclotella cryptica]|uniref:V-SNARE coiled-coil homology domain-containing protein n=1 Tax=Cyclotella cryptica TaxID=29204 RepID=A0ABD3PTA8_9STRA|eukprot:CCRYP_011598-RA/>CCRYP_011598-RA protein AED:0.44 eAED:0.44 QI:0/-1/0/1/-1/1/1/0/230
MTIAWSCVSRDGIILAEAGEDDGSGNVIKTAQKINKMKPTGGWEKTRSLRGGTYRGLKFHLHEFTSEIDDCSSDVLVWTFCCVYKPSDLSEDLAKAFLTKLVYVTEPLRNMPWWRQGGLLSAQPSFAPTLQQQMESVQRDGRISILRQHVDETKAIMASNITNILERGERIESLEEKSEQLEQMSSVFKKKAKQVKRMQQWQNAKYGVVVGTAITGVVGALVIPPLIALL